MTIVMRRSALSGLNNKRCEHAGLVLDRGFKEDRGTELHNDDKMQLFSDAQDISISEYYKKAYKDWKQTQNANSDNSQIWCGKLINRMYLGMGEASPLEAGISLHHTYGVPFIAGSAIKGVLHHYVHDLYAHDLDLRDDIKNILFGEEAKQDDKQHSGSAGCLIYNDAWWVPEGKALAPEMITVHAEKYYSSKGKKIIHPDFESPNPNPQIAIQGSFLFSIEGEKQWAEYAMRLLQKRLEDMGIGGKTASGYGYFKKEKSNAEKETDDLEKKLEEMLLTVKKEHNIPDHKQALVSKPLAEAWSNIEINDEKNKLLQLLENNWEKFEIFPSKKAQIIYYPE